MSGVLDADTLKNALIGDGITDGKVLDTIHAIPRELRQRHLSRGATPPP